jgi:hypothetical protein
MWIMKTGDHAIVAASPAPRARSFRPTTAASDQCQIYTVTQYSAQAVQHRPRGARACLVGLG